MRQYNRNWITVINSLLFIALISACAGGVAGSNPASSVTTADTRPEPRIIDYPLASISNFEYNGAFRIPNTSYGASSANYSEGVIAYNPTNRSIFLVGHEQDDAFAEFTIPELGFSTTDISSLPNAENIQPFVQFFDRVPNKTAGDKIDQVTGMYVNAGELIVNAAEFYDGAANNVDTTLVVRDASNLASSRIDGFYQLDGGVHSAGWISDIPADLKQYVAGYSHIVGYSSVLAINSRNSMGPTAFLLNLGEFENADSNISTVPVQDFSLSNYLHKNELDSGEDWEAWGINVFGDRGDPDTDGDGNIVTRGNDLWTEKSNGVYGFVIPGSRTYAVIGSSGGHESGIGYKITQDDGTLCGGFCSWEAADNYNYYWLWDIKDLVEVLSGNNSSSEARPYEYGKFITPFQYNGKTGDPHVNLIGGGAYDEGKNILYLTLKNAGQLGDYDRSPLILAYSINIIRVRPSPPTALCVNLSPNTRCLE
jgi:hypothetical protein